MVCKRRIGPTAVRARQPKTIIPAGGEREKQEETKDRRNHETDADRNKNKEKKCGEGKARPTLKTAQYTIIVITQPIQDLCQECRAGSFGDGRRAKASLHRCRLSASSSLRTSPPPRIKSRAERLEGLRSFPIFLLLLHSAAKSGISATIKPASASAPSQLQRLSLFAPLLRSVWRWVQFSRENCALTNEPVNNN